MYARPTAERVFQIFQEINNIPRPLHHEERVADYLCQFAERLHLEYQRDAQNNVVIRKPATPGHEDDEPIGLLNHMDMVCVGMDDALHSPIIRLSMALAVLESSDIAHGPLEVIYDTITAGACLQFHHIPMQRKVAPGGKRRWYRIRIEGGLGGHSGVDINKGRCSAVIPAWAILTTIYNEYDFDLASICIGEADASIASSAEMVLTIPSGEAAEFVKMQQEMMNQWLREEYPNDPKMACSIEKCERQDTVINPEALEALLTCLEQIPQGVVKMSETMKDTVETSNNVGRIVTEEDNILVTTHTHSSVDSEMEALSQDIANVFEANGATSKVVMPAPAWQEGPHSQFINDIGLVLQKLLSRLCS